MPNTIVSAVSRLRSTLCKISDAQDTIKAAETTAKAARRNIVIWAMDAGDDLFVIKKAYGHGNLGTWIKANVACKWRMANNYMTLASGRAVIEGEIRNGANLSITTALRLLAPKNTDQKSAKEDPYAAAILADLSAKGRARLIENLSIVATDVPVAVHREIGERAVDPQKALADREAREGLFEKFHENVRTAIATGEADVHKVAHIKALLEAVDDRTARTPLPWSKRMAQESRFRFTDDASTVKPGTVPPPTDPVPTVDPATPTKH
jgi:hypothetical protein